MTDGVPGLIGRREAREEALGMLYEMHATGADAGTTIAARRVPAAEYAEEMVRGVEDDGDELRATISRHLDRWRIERLAVIDRLLMELATWELTRRADVPTGVVLSEAVELASQYAGEESPRFVNGVLREVAAEVRAEG